jgi:hypothetical protein
MDSEDMRMNSEFFQGHISPYVGDTSIVTYNRTLAIEHRRAFLEMYRVTHRST